ncbi:MAG: pyridoxal-dependent decarboxylase [Flavobacteriaceae bacterium]|nr:pyridoxal-dependent decarboxylase [Flavobacteriaceae bacterium]
MTKSRHNKIPLQVNEVLEDSAELLLNFLEYSKSGASPVLQNEHIGDIANQLNVQHHLINGFQSKEEIKKFIKTYLDYSTQIHNPHYVGHQVSIPHELSIVPELIHGVLNNPTTLYEMGQSGATLEHFVINWMLSKLGWFKGEHLLDFRNRENGGSGFLTHGGSLANLTVLCAARASISPDAWTKGNPKDLVVMGPKSVHYSISRALSIMGLGSNAYVSIPTDKYEIIKADQIQSTYDAIIKSGKRVMLMIANGCATSTGYFDPIEEMGEFCSKNDIWFHVDGAHGAVALLSKKYKHFLTGIELADSMIWDAHKMMRTSTLCTAILFKKYKHQSQNLKQKGGYLFHEKKSFGKDTLPYTIECTKAPLGTKIYWALAAEGEKAMESYVESCFDKAREFYLLIEKSEDFEGFSPPETNIICYRYRPDIISNQQQLELRNKVIELGQTYITSTEILGTRYLRNTICNPLTKTENFLFTLQKIREAYSTLVGNHFVSKQ